MARSTTDRVSITSVREPASKDLEHRQHQYLLLMGIRILCLALIFVVPGILKLVALGVAVVLPAAAVLLANNADRRTHNPFDEPDPSTPALTSHHHDAVVPGQLVDED